MIYGWFLLLAGIFILGRGLWGTFRYIQGRGAKFYYLPGYEKLKNKEDLHWFSRYSLWNAMMFWVGSKENANKLERFYLIFGSIIQVIVGIMLLSLYIMDTTQKIPFWIKPLL